MRIRAHLITNDLRNQVRYQLLDLFEFCSKPSNQPLDINCDCIISSTENNNKAKATIYNNIDFMRLTFMDKAGNAHRLGDILNSVSGDIKEKITARVEKNVTVENLNKTLKGIVKRGRDSFLSNMQNFFFPSRRSFSEKDLYTQAYMSILERAYIFDIIEDSLRRFEQLDADSIFASCSDMLRLAYSYLRQMPIIAIIIVIIFITYSVFMIIKSGANLSLSGIAETIAMQHPAYFTAKKLTTSAVSAEDANANANSAEQDAVVNSEVENKNSNNIKRNN